MNTLNDTGRLAEAVGPDNAASLLQHVDSGYPQIQKIAKRRDLVGRAAKYAGAGYDFAKLAHGLLGRSSK